MHAFKNDTQVYYYRASDKNVLHILINRNARPNNNQLISYYLCVCYLQYLVNTTYNSSLMGFNLKDMLENTIILNNCKIF